MNPESAISRYKLEILSAESIVLLANSWLEAGVYTDALNFISMTPNASIFEVGPLLETAIKELDLKVPSRVDAARFITKETIEKMVSGKVGLIEGASFLYWEVHHRIVNELPDDEYMGTNLGLERIFCWLREIWDCRDGSMILYYTNLPRNEAELKFLEHLKEESENWLSSKA